MCGICGFLNFDRQAPVDPDVVHKMTAAMSHRGPDDDGFLFEPPVGLGFRRLSIIDLQGGHQPILNEDGSAAIVFNGEIYNYRDLSRTLADAGHRFKTRSDTETILHAYEQYGDECVHQLRGMFAFAIWDSSRRRMLLVRDRLGIKPLYYYQGRDFLAFASEIKSLLEIPGVGREVDADALDQYLALRYVPGPATMFRNIHLLQPGHLMVVDEAGVQIRKYWDVSFARNAEARPEMVEEFRDLLEESVRLRLISEVPLGVFLSGGLDSSAILACMSKAAGGRVKTFSVGYEPPGPGEEDPSEFAYAHLAANAFGSDHYEYRLTSREFQEFIPQLVWHLDQPMADPTCIPLHYISRLAREHITVVLSGEGADEILAGYNIYSRMLSVQNLGRKVPGLGKLAASISPLLPNAALRHYARISGLPLEATYRGVCRAFRPETRRALIGEARWTRSESRIAAIFGNHFYAVRNASALNRMLYLDTKVWLPDDLLAKADKMTMANSLELRVPFLDHKLVEFAAQLPDSAKLGASGGKALLRQAMRGTLPDTIIDRPKKGFPVPLAAWLRGPLREFTRDHLAGSDSACGRFLDRRVVARTVEEHEKGKDRSGELWALLVFEIWHRQFIGKYSRGRQAAA